MPERKRFFSIDVFPYFGRTTSLSQLLQCVKKSRDNFEGKFCWKWNKFGSGSLRPRRGHLSKGPPPAHCLKHYNALNLIAVHRSRLQWKESVYSTAGQHRAQSSTLHPRVIYPKDRRENYNPLFCALFTEKPGAGGAIVQNSTIRCSTVRQQYAITLQYPARMFM